MLRCAFAFAALVLAGLSPAWAADPDISVAQSLDAATSLPLVGGEAVVIDFAVNNSAASTLTQPAGYQFYEIVPVYTTFTSISNGTTDCLPGAVGGTLCTITVSNAIAPGSGQTVKFTVTMPASVMASLPASQGYIQNTATQNTSIPPSSLGYGTAVPAPPQYSWGCTASGSVCSSPSAWDPLSIAIGPDGLVSSLPECRGIVQPGVTCLSVLVTQPAITFAKTADPATPAVGPGQDAIFDLTFTNTVPDTAGYADSAFASPVFEIVPQNTVFKSVSANAEAYCGAAAVGSIIWGDDGHSGDPSLSVGAPAGTLCMILVSPDPIPYGSPRTVQFTVTAVSPLPAGTTEIFNAATPGYGNGDLLAECGVSDGGSSQAVVSGRLEPAARRAKAPADDADPTPWFCPTPPVGPACPDGMFCASVSTMTTLALTKAIEGGPAGGVTGSFGFIADCGADGTFTGTVTLTGATSGSGGIDNVPVGATCLVSEITIPAAPDNYQWGATPPAVSVTVTPAGPNTAAFTNTLTQQTGDLLITKTVTGGPAGGMTGSFSFTVDCAAAGTFTGIVALVNATTGTTTISGIPPGSTCTVSETTIAAAPASYQWGATPPAVSVTVTVAGPNTAAFTNTLTTNTTPPAPSAVPAPALRDGWLAVLAGLLLLMGCSFKKIGRTATNGRER